MGDGVGTVTPLYDRHGAQLYRGDCREVLRQFPDNHFDSCVCDPPYDLTSIVRRFGKPGSAPAKPEGAGGAYARLSKGFMGQRWDGTGVAFDPATWEAIGRTLKPGACLLAFGGTRTYHRIASAIEAAGFELRNCVAWIYGQGWPKSHNLHGDWEGWGTDLKPAMELIAMARKPLAQGSVAANMLEWGTGAWNIDGCRIEANDDAYTRNCAGDRGHAENRGRQMNFHMGSGHAHPQGRWPANVCFDEDAAALLDVQAGPQRSGGTPKRRFSDKTLHTYGVFQGDENPDGIGASAGLVSRFFYCAKASRLERDAGLDELPEQVVDVDARHHSRRMEELRRTIGAPPARGRNHHPTIKPLALLRWLVRLTTRPGGLVLDPFAGSCSTGCAAILEGFRFVGIDLDESGEYLGEIGRRRIEHWAQWVGRKEATPAVEKQPVTLPELPLFAGLVEVA